MPGRKPTLFAAPHSCARFPNFTATTYLDYWGELNADEKKMVFAFVDALVGKKKLKDALSGVLNDVK